MKRINIILISSALVSICVVGVVAILTKMSFKQKLIKIANKEIEKWKGLTELSQRASQTLISYWKSVGRVFSPRDMQSKEVHSKYPWSSAFISWLFFKAGAKKRFPYSAAHSGYFQVAKKNRDNPKAALRGFRITEYAPKVGDLVVYSRQQGKGYDSVGHFPSHGEVVIEVGKGFIKTVGGNVSNMVKASVYKTNAKGFLSGNSTAFFMVIQNNIK